MKLVPTSIAGAFLVEIEPVADERGYFARTFSREEFLAAGLDADVCQSSLSHNRLRGTLRGMHLQVAPWEESKLVGCTRGAVHDVLLDLRAGSRTFRTWTAIELRASSPRFIYVPKGVAHGFQTLEDDTVVTYQISQPYHPEAARGVRWDDATFAIAWPLPVACISAKDAALPRWVEAFGADAVG